MSLTTDHKPLIWSTLEEYEGDPEVRRRKGPGDFRTKPAGFYDAIEQATASAAVAENDDEAEKLDFTMQRRTFLRLSGFAAVIGALAGATGCQKPEEKILPYVKAPEEVTPGLATKYASVCGGCEAACGVIVKTKMSRPIKLEGNPAHPVNKGSLCARGQASVLELYDPDRYREPQVVATAATADWAQSDARIAAALAGATKKAVLLTGTINGPAREKLVADFQKVFPAVQHVMYDALSEEAARDAQAIAFGDAVLPRYHFEKSKVTVLLGSDPISDAPSPVEAHAGIAAQRKLRAVGDGKKEGQKKYAMGKLYAFEPLMSLTGMNADERHAVRPEHLAELAGALNVLVAAKVGRSAGSLALPSVDPKAVETKLGLKSGLLEQVATDLVAARGESLVYAGGQMSAVKDAVALQVLAAQLNALLGNEGTTVDSRAASQQRRGSDRAMLDLIADMNNGLVEVLLVDGCNPAYALPASAGFEAAMKKVALKVSFSPLPDETTRLCDLVLPGLHALEIWGDSEPYLGVLGLQQPTINPLWNNRAFEQSLIAIAYAHGGEKSPFVLIEKPKVVAPVADGAASPTPTPRPTPTPIPPRMIEWREYVQQVWQGEVYAQGDFAGDAEEFWFAALRRGVLEVPARVKGPASPRALRQAEIAKAIAGIGGASASGFALVTYTNGNTYDGRHANNPWLLELPDPVSKVAWDNYAAMSPRVAKEQGLEDGDIIAIQQGATTIEAPVRRHPGIHPDVIAVAGGWGRQESGTVGVGIGAHVFAAGAAGDGAVVRSGLPVTFEKTGKRMRLADMQGHNYMQTYKDADPTTPQTSERQLVIATSLEDYNADNKNPQPYYHIPYWKTGRNQPKPDIWDGDREEPMKEVRHKWAMTIDLNACTGCNACVVACQAENNIPVVGKREVLRGREMHWIRIDRYYKGEPEAPEVAKMPMLCQHCDNAPCETVCPALATMHSDEGINMQVYNRCIGTRYCANNCPYKVRRFNFYQYSNWRQGPHNNNYGTGTGLGPQEWVKDSPIALALNPDITVRTRGIMEKCTFCQERIRDAKYEAKLKGRNIPNGELKTACQQTCPAKAITFGDKLNPEHDVNPILDENFEKRGYGVLAEFNTKPNVMYLAQVFNREHKEWDHSYSALSSHGGHGHVEHSAEELKHDEAQHGLPTHNGHEAKPAEATPAAAHH